MLLAPELFHLKTKYDGAKVDMFNAGCILVGLCYKGQQPTNGHSGSVDVYQYIRAGKSLEFFSLL